MAFNTLRLTLSDEHRYDRSTAYDVKGCPMDRDFSEKSKMITYDRNWKKNMRYSKRPGTARKLSKNRSKSPRSHQFSLNNSYSHSKSIWLSLNYVENKKRSIFTNFDGVESIPRYTLVPTSSKKSKTMKNQWMINTSRMKANMKKMMSDNKSPIKAQNKDKLYTLDHAELYAAYSNMSTKQSDQLSRNFNNNLMTK